MLIVFILLSPDSHSFIYPSDKTLPITIITTDEKPFVNTHSLDVRPHNVYQHPLPFKESVP